MTQIHVLTNRCVSLVSRAGLYMRPFCSRERSVQYESSSSYPRRQGILRRKLNYLQVAKHNTHYRELSHHNITDRSIKQHSYCSLFKIAGIPKYNYVPKRYASTIRQKVEELQKNDLEKSVDTAYLSERPSSPNKSGNVPTIQNAMQPAVKRQLGDIEAMYELYASRGSDIASIVTGVQSVYEISEDAVRWSLRCLMLRHPLLRSTISYERQPFEQDKVAMFFVENNSMEPDFEAIDRSDWFNFVLEEPNRTFDNSKLPLWRVRMLKAADDTDGFFCPTCSTDNSTLTGRYSDSLHRHNAVFIITANHTIMDAGYCIWIFKEFFNFLEAFLLRTPIVPIKELPMLLPIENCIRQPPAIQTTSCDFHLDDPLCQARLCFDAPGTFILDAYNNRFSGEIKELSKHSPQTGSLYLKLSKKATSSFMDACKRKDVKTTGALTTACVLALVDFIFPASVQLPDFEIPIEHMIDLRRLYNIDGVDKTTVPFFTGVAVIPVDVCIQLTGVSRPVNKSTFWKIARSLARFASKTLGKPNETVFNNVKNSKDVFNRSDLRQMTEKSPYVLCISNIGNLDHVLQDSLDGGIKVTSLVPHINILTEDMPIFFISTQTLNGQLTVLIAYCKSYTSTQTAQCYMEKLNNYIQSYALSN